MLAGMEAVVAAFTTACPEAVFVPQAVVRPGGAAGSAAAVVRIAVVRCDDDLDVGRGHARAYNGVDDGLEVGLSDLLRLHRQLRRRLGGWASAGGAGSPGT